MNGQGRNDTAVLPDVPPDQQQPGGWPGGGWPGGGWPPPPHGGPPQKASDSPSKPLIFTVAALVVVAVIAAAAVLWPDGDDKNSGGPSSSPAAVTSSAASSKPNSAARLEAVAVNRVLNASTTSRGGLARALAAANSCKRLPIAIGGFERVARERQAQLAATRRLRVGHLANGARLRQSLYRSIQYSLAADRSFLNWARGNQGCKGKPKPDANYQRARGPLSAQASAAKRQFVALWTPVARQAHLKPRTANGF